MFARQVDPLAAFNSAIPVADSLHRSDKDNLHCHQSHSFTSSYSHSTPSSTFFLDDDNNNNNNNNNSQKDFNTTSYNPYKRKHPLQFEPDFFAALDASLQEFHDDEALYNDTNDCLKASLPNLSSGSPWSPRPCKRTRNSTSKCSASHSTGLRSDEPTSPTVSPKRSETPSLSNNYTKTTEAATSIPCSANQNRISSDPPSRHNSPTVFPQTSSFSSAWSHKNIFPMSPRNSKGPSIIDLSSGEELMPILHFNDKEQHKRRRNSLCDSPTSESTESLHQRFELQDDGTLLPILDPSPTDPSPPKKMRISKANRHQYLHFLSDDESEIERLSSKMKAGLRRKKAHHSFIGSNRTYRSVNTGRIACNGGTTVFSTTEAIGSSHVHQGSYTGTKIFWSDQRTDLTAGDTSHAEDALFDQMGSFHKEEPSKEDEQLCLSSCNSDPQALILYKGPRNVSLTPYYQAYDQDQWLDDRNNGLIELEWPQGHEMVYYQNEPTSCDSSTRFGQRRSILWGDYDALNEGSTTSVLIEELNDDIDDDEDDGNLADDEENDLSDDAPLRDLEEHVADMDLD